MMPRARGLLTLAALTITGCGGRPEASVLPPHSVVHRATGIELVLIPGGSYMRGGSPDDALVRGDPSLDGDLAELPRLPGTVGPFYLGRFEVTRRQWNRIMNPDADAGSDGGSDDNPIANVTWIQASEFVRRIGMRLPSECEWEYAARAGSNKARYGELNDIAWFCENSDNSPHAVGRKAPNAWGLYDVLGNVMEWCSDPLSGYGVIPDERRSADGTFVTRGGSCASGSGEVRVSHRYGLQADDSSFDVGLRAAADTSIVLRWLSWGDASANSDRDGR